MLLTVMLTNLGGVRVVAVNHVDRRDKDWTAGCSYLLCLLVSQGKMWPPQKKNYEFNKIRTQTNMYALILSARSYIYI